MLELTDLSIRFGGHLAVDGVTCRFDAGTLTAIVGPNGAGKTTLFNLVSGQLRATRGRVTLEGEDLSALSAPKRARKGLGRAFQLTQLFPRLSVRENVRLAVQSRHRGGRDVWRVWLDHRDWIAAADALLRTVALDERATTPAGALSHGDQRKLEVAMLMALDPKVYMFDEPTAGMSLDEVPMILELIQAIRRRRDRCILLVEHKMDVLRELSDRVVVLTNGRLVADGEPAQVMRSDIVQRAYLGAMTPPAQALP